MRISVTILSSRQVQPEQEGEFDDFIDDGINSADEEADEEADREMEAILAVGKCINIIEVDGEEIICGEECNPAEQLCHSCKRSMRF